MAWGDNTMVARTGCLEGTHPRELPWLVKLHGPRTGAWFYTLRVKSALRRAARLALYHDIGRPLLAKLKREKLCFECGYSFFWGPPVSRWGEPIKPGDLCRECRVAAFG